MDWFAAQIQANLQDLVRLSDEQTAKLYSHFELLLLWNRKLNLTSIRSPEEVVLRHYCEGLFFAFHLPDTDINVRIADIGSGAGFPGVPMAVFRSDWRVTLVESHQRKGVFLRQSTRELYNVRVLVNRAEIVTEQFDWIVSRAIDAGQVLRLIPKVASRVGLLIGAGDANAVLSRPGFQWSDPVRLPWGERRVCLFGRPSFT